MTRILTEAQLREVISRTVLNFRARSASSPYTSGHALQPSDTVRLTDEILDGLRPHLIGKAP